MTLPRRSEAGLSLSETLVSITIFSIITIGMIPLLATAMRGGATTRTESVARNVTAKALERLRGLQYHVAYSSSPRPVDVLDLFFPGVTPAYVASVGTGYDAASRSYVTTCDSASTTAACKTLPGSAAIPSGFVLEVRATFRSADSPATTVAVPAGYAWNATGADRPPSDLIEVKITTTWAVGTRVRSFPLTSYLSARGRLPLPAPAGGPASAPPAGGSSAPSAPATVKLRAEARIDYGYEMTTTYQDAQSPPRLSEYTGTLGTAVAYGEQLDSGSKADLTVRAGQLRKIRPADPAVTGDLGVDVNLNGAALDAHAPADATSTTTTTGAAVTAAHPEITMTGGMGFLAASEAGTLAGPRGAGPTVAGGLPFVKGYYDFNGTTPVSPITNSPTHLWMMPQTSLATSGTATTTNPLGLTTDSTKKMITVSDYQPSGVPSTNVDPRGEVAIDSTPTSPASSRQVTATATIPPHGMIRLFPMTYSPVNNGYFNIDQFSASVSCAAHADPATPSTASGSWSALLSYASHEGTSKKDVGYKLRQTTLPTQTRMDNPDVPYGDTNPLQTIRSMNGGNGPKVYDADGNAGDTAHDAWLFAANGKRGLLTGWSQGSVQTSISADDRVVSAQLNGAIRLETSPLFGPWQDPSTGQVSQRPNSDVTFAMGKLGCKAEDYR